MAAHQTSEDPNLGQYKNNYEGFIGFVKWGTIACIVIVVLLAVFVA